MNEKPQKVKIVRFTEEEEKRLTRFLLWLCLFVLLPMTSYYVTGKGMYGLKLFGLLLAVKIVRSFLRK